MKPGHIRVFDGLRITTEHMEHLQGSLHSALEDLRTILGLGQVYYGFEVEAEGGSAVVIHPGLAFDSEKNRIVLDEPKTVPVSFAPGEESKYVCIRYDQVEDGQVEGQYTLIWDSCAVVLRPSEPEPDEGLIAVARLDRTSDDGGAAFNVESLTSTEHESEAADEETGGDQGGNGATGEATTDDEATDDEATDEELTDEGAADEGATDGIATPTEEGGAAVSAGTSDSAGASDSAGSPDSVAAADSGGASESPVAAVSSGEAGAAGAPGEPAPASAPAARPEETPPSRHAEVREAAPTLRANLRERFSALSARFSATPARAAEGRRETEAPPAADAPPQATARSLRVRQGVVRLTADNDAGDYLGALLTEPLKKKLSAAKEGTEAGELFFNISRQDVELDFAPASLTCQTLIKLALAFDGEGKESATATGLKFHSAANGEATFVEGDAQQFGLSTVYAEASAGATSGATPVAELSERGVAHLPLGPLAGGADGDAFAALLRSLQLRTSVARADGHGFRVLCSLVWAGTINEEVIKTIESRKPRLTWETLVAWKALGDPFALTR